MGQDGQDFLEHHLRRSFSLIDVNQDGSVDAAEIVQAFQNMGLELSLPEATKILQRTQGKESDVINFKMYIQMHMRFVRAVFEKLDTDGDGSIDVGEMRKGFNGDTDAFQHANELFKALDSNSDDSVTLDEFVRIYSASMCFVHNCESGLCGGPADCNHDQEHALTEMELRFYVEPSVHRLVSAMESLDGFAVMVPSKHPLIGDRTDEARPFLTGLCAGGIAGSITKTFVAPLERVKMLLQVSQSSRGSGTILTASHVYRSEGIAAFWKGNMANCVRIMPTSAVNWGMYSYLKGHYAAWTGTPKNRKLPVAHNLMIGGLAGASACAVTYPLDLARTRITTSAADSPFQGLFSCISHTLRAEGVAALYRGVGISLAGVVPYLAISTTTWELLQQFVPPKPQKASSFKSMLHLVADLGTGSAAGVISQTVTYPLDTLRRRMQVHTGVPMSALQCAKNVAATEGISALYAGVGANAIKAIPAAGIWFFVAGRVSAFIKERF